MGVGQENTVNLFHGAQSLGQILIPSSDKVIEKHIQRQEKALLIFCSSTNDGEHSQTSMNITAMVLTPRETKIPQKYSPACSKQSDVMLFCSTEQQRNVFALTFFLMLTKPSLSLLVAFSGDEKRDFFFFLINYLQNVRGKPEKTGSNLSVVCCNTSKSTTQRNKKFKYSRTLENIQHLKRDIALNQGSFLK